MIYFTDIIFNFLSEFKLNIEKIIIYVFRNLINFLASE